MYLKQTGSQTNNSIWTQLSDCREKVKIIWIFFFNFCGLVVGLVGLGFPPTIKLVAEKFFDVEKLQ